MTNMNRAASRQTCGIVKMPVITSGHGCRSGEDGIPIPTYQHMMVYATFIDADLKYIETQRKLHRRLHDEIKSDQKAAGKAKDFALARELSDEATKHLRFYRAACLILPYWKPSRRLSVHQYEYVAS